MEGLPTRSVINGVNGVPGWDEKNENFLEVIPVEKCYWIKWSYLYWRIYLMKKTITIMTEEFENEKTGEKVEGITIMVDGVLKQLFEIIKREKNQYTDNVSIVQDALMKGLENIKNTI